MLDMGVISEEEALKRMQARLETDHAKEMAALCLAHWHEYNMWPMESMGELVRELKAMGYGIYLCSNASEPVSYTHLKKPSEIPSKGDVISRTQGSGWGLIRKYRKRCV